MIQRQLPQFKTTPLEFEDILTVFERGDVLTRANIARRLSRSKSPELIAMIEMMVDGGILAKTTFAGRNGLVGFEYEVIQDDRN